MLTQHDKEIILNIIKTGNYNNILNLKEQLNPYTKSKIIFLLKSDDSSKNNYFLAGKLTNILIPENSNLKKNINNLISTELNYYDKGYARDKAYQQLNSYVTNLVAFPLKKRIQKFLMKFAQASKELQDVLKNQNKSDLKILKILQNISLEVRKNADD